MALASAADEANVQCRWPEASELAKSSAEVLLAAMNDPAYQRRKEQIKPLARRMLQLAEDAKRNDAEAQAVAAAAAAAQREAAAARAAAAQQQHASGLVDAPSGRMDPSRVEAHSHGGGLEPEPERPVAAPAIERAQSPPMAPPPPPAAAAGGLDPACEESGDACAAAAWALSERLLRPRDSQQPERASAFMWHWQSAGRGEAERWEPYSAEMVLRLEYELRQRQHAQVQIDHGYIVDITEMLQAQYNAADAWQFSKKTPDRKRRVRRALWYSNVNGVWGPDDPVMSIEMESLEKQKKPDMQRAVRWDKGYARGWAEVCQITRNAEALLRLVATGYEYAVAALAVDALGCIPWDAAAWQRVFEEQLAKQNYQGTKALRVLVMRNTLLAISERQYVDGSGRPTELNLTQMLRPAIETIRHIPGHNLSPIAAQAGGGSSPIVAKVVSTDCVEVGLSMQEQGLNPAVLNMANAIHAGGGYLSGAGAQEENLCRRSVYCLALEAPDHLHALIRQRKTDHYPLGDAEGLYTPDVLVLRRSEDAGYAWLPEPRRLSFVAVAAIDRPRVTRDRPPRLASPERELTAEKIRTILRIAHYHRHDALVLSALGCGAFGNPPADVAAVFYEVLSEPEFHGVFRTIVFAILDDQNAGRAHNPDGNFLPFLRQFPDGR